MPLERVLFSEAPARVLWGALSNAEEGDGLEESFCIPV